MVALAASAGVTSISRSRAFISATDSMRPARTEPWQAIVAATWSSFSPQRQRLAELRPVRRRGRASSAADVGRRRAAPGVARTSIAPGPKRSISRPSSASSAGALLEPVAVGLVELDHLGNQQRLARDARRRPSAARIRSSTSRSCAACWSTITRPSSASATI